MVSVCCLAYNHSKYIRKCLDGFVNQKTNFTFEVLIHDDASTDGTQDIIREYEEKYPNIIKPIYQTENQYSKHIGINKTFQYPRVKGKYIAFCEGDDYWTDSYKLQKQFDILECNPDCSLCVHGVNCVSENGILTENTFPEIKIASHKFLSKEWLELYFKIFRLTQTSSFFIRGVLLDDMIPEPPLFMAASPVGDKALALLCIAKGNVYYIDEFMSAYRLCSQGSWSEGRISWSDEMKKTFVEKTIKTLEEYNKYTNFEFEDLIDYAIRKEEYWYYLVNHEYKEVLKLKYRQFFKDLSFKEKVYAYLKFMGNKRKNDGQ